MPRDSLVSKICLEDSGSERYGPIKRIFFICVCGSRKYIYESLNESTALYIVPGTMSPMKSRTVMDGVRVPNRASIYVSTMFSIGSPMSVTRVFTWHSSGLRLWV